MNGQAEKQVKGLEARRLWTVALLGAAGLMLIGLWWLLGLLVEHNQTFLIEHFDRPPVELFGRNRSEGLTTFMRGATFLGGTVSTAVLLTVGAVGSYLMTKNRRWPAFFAGALVGSLGLARILQPVVGRARPDLDPILEIASGAFPSGHATASAVCFGALAYFAALSLRRPWSAISCVGAGLIVVLVGMTRVYLGVHWPTDVIAGWALGATWVVAVALATRPLYEDE
jgi:membrane-associated phospholipid phosphatase